MLLIDGYNVLFARGVMKDVREAREKFIARIESYCARTGQRARIYFDSREGPLRGRKAHVEIQYVASGETADDAILRAVRGTEDRTEFRVVSSDRAVADGARKRKAEVTAALDFLNDIEAPAPPAAEPKAKREGISQAEAEYWLKEFGMQGGGDEAR